MTKISKKKGVSTSEEKESKVDIKVEEKSETEVAPRRNNTAGSGGAFIELGGGIRVPAS